MRFKSLLTLLMFLAALILEPVHIAASFAAEAAEPSLSDIRARIRDEAGLGGENYIRGEGVAWEWQDPEVVEKGEDLPMVSLTVLPGDTYARLSEELTGSLEAVKILKAVAPTLTPGEKILLPNTLLRPRLSDPETASFTLGQDAPTLKALVEKVALVDAKELPWQIRNLQRLNHIVDPSKIPASTAILIPEALLKVTGRVKPDLQIREDYQVREGFKQKAAKTQKKSSKRKSARVKYRDKWVLQARTSPIDLVVVHTTEHQATPFENVAAYIRARKLANYLIGPKGEVYRILPEKYRAYGCGESLWDGRYDTDHQAINIEIYSDTAPGAKYGGINDEQYAGLKKLLEDIGARIPAVHSGRVVTHSMVAASFKYGTRSRKGDPYEFDWAKAGLPNNSVLIDRDVLLGKVSLCTDKRYADRITPGQTAAAELLHKM